MSEGIVKHINADRGFGFIRRIGERDLFFHFTDWTGPPEFGLALVGMRVTFDIGENHKDGKLLGLNVRSPSAGFYAAVGRDASADAMSGDSSGDSSDTPHRSLA